MNRREQLRQYWEARIPDSASFYLVDAARVINRGRERPLVSLRTLQRRAADGALPCLGAPDRAIQQYRVLREDLIEFLCGLDVVTGTEPPDPRPREVRRRERREQVRAIENTIRAAATRPPSRPTKQRDLFED